MKTGNELICNLYYITLEIILWLFLFFHRKKSFFSWIITNFNKIILIFRPTISYDYNILYLCLLY